MPRRHATIILFCIAIGVVAAGFTGWLWGEGAQQIGFLGTLFLNALRMLIIPLIVAAVISGVAALGDVRKFGKLGGFTVGYYICTSIVAGIIGLTLVNVFEPGAGVDITGDEAQAGETSGAEDVGFTDVLLKLVAPNLVKAAAETDLLPLILFALVFAAALTTIGEAGKPVIAFFEGVNEVMMKLVGWLMYAAPIGIFALVAARLGKAGGGAAFLEELQAVGAFVGVVLLGIGLHFLVLTGVAMIVARRGLSYLKGLAGALMTAFGTASSSATLPVTMEAANNEGVSRKSTRFVLPLGSTVNMDGTALYEAVAALFIAQAHGLNLGFFEQLLVLLTGTVVAIGAAGIPEAGLVTMVIVLNAVGLPLEGIGLLLAVDWFLDRFRTATNVWGDAVGASVMDRLLPESAKQAAPEPEAA